MLAILFGLLGIFSTNGFSETPKAFSVSDTIRLNKKKVNYDTSHYLIVNRIFIIGNNKTRDQIILRELSLHQGDVVDSAELILILERDKRKLYNTRLFNRTDVRTLEFEPGRIDILVDVNERWYTFPTPRFELSDRNFNEWWENYNHDINRVVYGIKLYQYNMRGRNETLLVTALLGFQRKLSLIYRIPYLNKKQKQGLIFDFDFTEAKNVAYRTVDHKLVYEKLRTLQKYSTLTGLTYTYRNSFYQTHS
ncbi:MAG TPA: POTRA domain-containing protein, partial [Cyclobacteriaceae bacterium]